VVKIIEESTNQNKKAGQATFESDKVTINLNYSLCINCGLCISNCPHNVLIWQDGVFKENKHKIDIVGISDLYKCNACGRCQEICKPRAIVIK
jgi:formate hydrogenlyase subunit 6/NADH:ubiquinone oxidoreductase subunit I